MKSNKIKNILILLNILFYFYLNNKIPIIIHKQNLIKEEPKISVIMPVYNGAKYLNNSLNSIQKQKLKDFEIIIIDDNSSDNSLAIIQNYIKNDKRIKLIKNKENRRILFSKSFGALNSKGKYILEIDQDDMFIRDDAFKILYKESEKYELDMLNFNYISGIDALNLAKINIHEKIKNSENKFKLNFKPSIALLWGNLIKTDIYKKVIYNLWPIIINYKIIFQEDFLITFFIIINARKYKRIKDIFYYYFINKKQISSGHKNNFEYYISVIFTGIIFYDYYIDYYSSYFNIIIKYIKYLKEDFKRIKILYPLLFDYFFSKILSNNQLLKMDKVFIKNEFKISEISYSKLNLDRNQRKNFNKEKSNNNTYIHCSKDKFPKLTIIIVCSKFKNTEKIIKIINNQNFKSFEVIIIYDDINQKEYNLLNNFIKSYCNIKLMHNKRKKGTLYSISKGVQLSNGKYLMIINENCFFLNENSFKNLYEEIQKDGDDILEFNLYKILPNNFISLYKCKHYVSQFNLSQIKYNLEFNEIDIKNELLTNKIPNI